MKYLKLLVDMYNLRTQMTEESQDTQKLKNIERENKNMFFRKYKGLKKVNVKLREKISNLISEKAFDKSVYKDELYKLAIDKNIQEENNIKLLSENMRLNKKLNEIKNAKNMNEIKEILDGVQTIIISQ